MKKLIQIMFGAMGLMVVSALAVFGDGGNQLQNQAGGNQLAQGYTHWYEKAVDSAGPVEEVGAKGGTLLILQKESSLYMIGDSTLHQYQMRAGTLKGSAAVKGGLLKALKAGEVGPMSLIVPVSTFKSRESGLDNNAYKALKSDKNPDIKFDLEKTTFKAGAKNGAYTMTAKGNLTIAGVTAPITLTGDALINGDKIEIKGVQKLKMSDYKVAPPSISLLVASITCSDQIEIHYDVVFAPEGEAQTGAGK